VHRVLAADRGTGFRRGVVAGREVCVPDHH
jgi:hypothetical protein